MPAGMKRVKIWSAINAENDRLAVDDKMLLPVRQRGFDDPGIALALVVPALRKQPHAIVIALNPQAITVVLDLVKPFWTGGNLGSAGRNAEFKRLTHVLQDRRYAEKCESSAETWLRTLWSKE
jgi:hypothetical protein